MLQESIVTLILSGEGLDWGEQSNRDTVSSAIKLLSMKNKKIQRSSGLDNDLLERLLSNTAMNHLYHAFESLRGLRNDVSHCGFITDVNNHARSAESIKERFVKIYDEVKQKLLLICDQK